MFADAVKTPEGRRITDELVADTQVMMRCYGPRPMVAPSTLSDAQLRSIRVPTMLVIGENETVGSAKRAMRRVARVAPQIRAELVAGAGHDLPIAQRARTLELVMGFLDAP
jgi:pimeloyl-ACP methyl ester carboxylesterase